MKTSKTLYNYHDINADNHIYGRNLLIASCSIFITTITIWSLVFQAQKVTPTIEPQAESLANVQPVSEKPKPLSMYEEQLHECFVRYGANGNGNNYTVCTSGLNPLDNVHPQP